MANIKDALEQIKEVYLNDNTCMWEVLSTTNITELPGYKNMTLEDTFDLFINAMEWAEGDTFYRRCGFNSELEEL